MKLTIRPRLRSPKSRFDDRVHELPEQELRSCINVLFVCKTLHRIALPHFYATVTIYWNQFILKRAGFLTRPDFYYIIPLNRLRNLCSTKQHVGQLKTDDASKRGFLHQLATLKIETTIRVAYDGVLSSNIGIGAMLTDQIQIISRLYENLLSIAKFIMSILSYDFISWTKYVPSMLRPPDTARYVFEVVLLHTYKLTKACSPSSD